MYADGLYSRSKVGAFLAIAVALAATPRATLAGGWVEFTEESPTRMIADNGVGMDDFEEKAFGVGDVDGDGDDDLVVVRKVDNGSNSGPLRNVLFLNEDGVLVDHTADQIPGFLNPTTNRDVVLADVDGDGWLDIITTQAFDGAPRIYMNQGEVDGEWQGFVYEAARIPLSGSPNFSGVAAGDIDKQNGPDLYFVEYETGYDDKLLLNDGNGFFTDVTQQRLSGSFWISSYGTAVEIVDLNGDGELDIVKSENGPVKAAYNDGAGFFPVTQTVYTGAAYHFATFDIENDGDLDFYVSDDGTDRYAINLSTNPNGTVQFVEYTAASSTNGFGSDILIADFNNDEFDDLMVADVDVDVPSCTGHSADLLRNTGVGDSGNMIDTLPLGSLTPSGVHDQAAIDLNEDGWLDLIVGKCTGYDIFINLPPLGIVFSYPSGLPTFVAPDEALVLQVQVVAVGVGELDSSSPTFHLSIDGGAFEATPMTDLGDGLYAATLPAHACLTRFNFYVSAQLMTGEEFLDPRDAPAGSHEAIVALGTELLLRDTMEDDVSDWEVSSDPSLTGGEWEQADPTITFWPGCGVIAPPADATNGDFFMAFVTENSQDGDESHPEYTDVDGGPTFLTSPVLDLSGTDGVVSYARWFRTCLGSTDLLTVEVSNDGGDSWTVAEQVGDTPEEWQLSSFQVSDFVAPTDNIRVRFSTADPEDDSLTDAGIDNFQVDVFVCGDDQPCEGDANGDGTVDPLDSGYVLARFGCPVGTGDPDCDSADQNGDGAVDPLDSGFVLARFGDCP